MAKHRTTRLKAKTTAGNAGRVVSDAEGVMHDHFFPGDSELAGRMRALDWSKTDLGPPENWPENLRIALAICLTSRFPMQVWWGPDFTMLYNDAYIPFLGSGKHPHALGRSAREIWLELWHQIGPMLEKVRAEGIASWSEDIQMFFDRKIPISEGGEEVYVSFSFSPIFAVGQGGVDDRVEGAFCACTEVTEKVLGARLLLQRQELLNAALTASDTGTFRWDPRSGEFLELDENFKRLFGCAAHETLRTAADAVARIHPDDIPGVAAAVEACANGADFDREFRVVLADGGVRWLYDRAKHVPAAKGSDRYVVGAVTDITERKQFDALMSCQKDTMEKAALGTPLIQVLTFLAQGVEQNFPQRPMIAIHLLDASGTRFAQTVAPSLPPEYAQAINGMQVSSTAGPCGAAICGRERVAVADVAAEGAKFPAFAAFALPLGIRAGLTVPILSSTGQPLGTVAHYYREPREPRPQDYLLGDIVTRTASVIIERTQGEEALRQSRQQLAAELASAQALQEVSTQMIRGGDVEVLYERIMDAAVTLMRSDYASMQMLYPERGSGGELKLLASRGFSPEAEKFFEWVRADSKCICGMVMSAGSRAIVPDVRSCEAWAGTKELAAYLEGGILACQSTPLISRSGKLLGMISTHWKQPHQPGESDLRQLDMLARQAADLIDRTQAEEALRESQAGIERQRRLYEAIVSNTPDLAYVFDLNHRFTYANEGLLKMWGRTWDEAIGKNCLELGYEPWHAELHDREIEQVIATKQPVRGEVPFTGALGRRIYDYIFVPVLNAEGEVEAVAGTTRDVTERKRTEINLAFLAEISQDLMRLAGVDEIMQSAGAKIGAYVDLSLCAFAEINEAADEGVVTHDWHREDVPSAVGAYRLGEFLTGDFQRAGRAGEVFVVRDTVTDRRTDAEKYAALKIHSFVCVPLVRDGQWRFLLAIYDSKPRDWRDDEIELIRELTTRIWTRLERARAETALHESESRYRALFDSAPMAVFVCDVNAVIQHYNQRAAELWGREPICGVEKHCGSTKLWLPDGTLLPHHQSPMVDMLRTGVPVHNVEVFIERPDGLLLPVLVNFAALKNAEGEVTGAITSFIDITDRKQAEEALRESEQRLRFVLDSAPQKIFTAKPSGDVDYFNPQWMEFTGLSFEQIRDWGWTQFIHPDDVEENIRLWQRSIDTGEPFDFEHRFRRADGEYRWHISRASAMKDAEGRTIMWIGSNTDINDQKRLIEEREALLDSERAARNEAERTGRLKDEFLATLSHELRTPLNAILGYAQLLRMSDMEKTELDESIATIERNARLQAQMIEDLLDMNRIISGKVRLDLQRLDLGEVIDAAVGTVLPSIEAKGIRLDKLLDPLAGPVRGDPARIQQIVWNLLSNAVKFTPKEGRIQVALERVNSHVEITVSDSGQGIAPEFLPHVFDRFRQADASTTRTHGGLGLGLSIVRQLVELHGGTVNVKSPGLGQGAMFTVALPVILLKNDEQRKERSHPQSSQAPWVECDVDLAGIQVLVVDDERDGCKIVKRLLEECKAEVETALSATEAYMILQERRFDVLVSDIGMPGEDGYQFIRRIRTNPGRNQEIPAVALTAFARSEDRRRAALSGFQNHLAKPVDAAELVAVVASLMGRAGTPLPSHDLKS